MTRPCKGCGCQLPEGYFDCTGDECHAGVHAVADAIATLSKLTKDDRKKALQQFCRDCYAKIDGPDWSGRNYCCDCSPDPLE